MKSSVTILKKYNVLLLKLSRDFTFIYYPVCKNLNNISVQELDYIKDKFIKCKMQECYNQLLLTLDNFKSFDEEVFTNFVNIETAKQKTDYNARHETEYQMVLFFFSKNLKLCYDLIKYGYRIYSKIIRQVKMNNISRNITEYDKGSNLMIAYNSKENFGRIMEKWDGIYMNIFDVIHELMVRVKTFSHPLPVFYPNKGNKFLSNPPELQPKEYDDSESKNTPTKDQILLISMLGILDMPDIKNLTMVNKGKLFATLLNRNIKNTTEYIRNCDPNGHKHNEDNPYKYENKVDAVIKFLEEVGFFKK